MQILYLLLFFSFSAFCMNSDDELTDKEREKQKRLIEKCTLELVNTINERFLKKMDLNTPMQNYIGQTPLHRACIFDESGELVRKLLSAGAQVNVRDDEGQTPLNFVCKYARPSSITNIKLLLEHAADPNIPGNTGWYPIAEIVGKPLKFWNDFLVRKSGAKAWIKMLLAHGANPFIKGENNETPLQMITHLIGQDTSQLITHIYNHKKLAYLLLLRGKDPRDLNYSLFNKLPSDIIKLILDLMFPGFPLPPSQLNHSQFLAFMKEDAKKVPFF